MVTDTLKISSISLFSNKIIPKQLSDKDKASSKKNKCKTLKKVAKKAFNSFSHNWKYISMSMKLTSSTIGVVTNSGKWIEYHTKIYQGLKQTSFYLKIFSFLNLPFTIIAIPTKLRKVQESVKVKDHEGALLSGLSCFIATGGLLKSIASFVNIAATMIIKSPIRGLTYLNPLSAILTGITGITHCYSLYQTTKFKHNFEKKLFKKITKDQCPLSFTNILQPFLDHYIGENGNQINEENRKLKAIVLERKSNAYIVKKFDEIACTFKKGEIPTAAQTEKIYTHIKEIKKSLHEETLFQAGSVLTSVMAILAMTINASFVPIVPSVLIASNSLLKFSMKICRKKNKSHKPT